MNISSRKHHLNKLINELFVNLLIISFLFLAGIGIATKFLHIPIQDILTNFFSVFVLPFSYKVVEIKSKVVLLPLLFLLIVALTTISLIIFIYFQKRSISWSIITEKLFLSIVSVLLVTSIIQWGYIQRTLNIKKSFFENVPGNVIYQKAHIYSYEFSLFLHNLIQGRHEARLITDLSIANSFHHMKVYRRFLYHMYPKFTFVDDENAQYLVVFMKRDASAAVANNYEIIGQLNKYSLIAKRK